MRAPGKKSADLAARVEGARTQLALAEQNRDINETEHAEARFEQVSFQRFPVGSRFDAAAASMLHAGAAPSLDELKVKRRELRMAAAEEALATTAGRLTDGGCQGSKPRSQANISHGQQHFLLSFAVFKLIR